MGVHVSVDDDVVPLPEGRVEEEHGVQETTRGWKANTPRYWPPYKVVAPEWSEDVINDGSKEEDDVVVVARSCLGLGTGTTARWDTGFGLPVSK